jgi:hypothetical protein
VPELLDEPFNVYNRTLVAEELLAEPVLLLLPALVGLLESW